MKWSHMMLPTLKEIPAEAEAISHILMIRAGLIRKLTSGVYSYLPLGFRVLKKIEEIIREEMNKKGAQEVLMPAIHPVELWAKSGRLEALGEDMIKFTDRHKKINVLGPTHEEVITALVKNEVSSYRQLPLIIYQIQTKFRDEARPRFGIIRSREFIMKDAYSFDCDIKGLNENYKKMYEAYCEIFKRCGLNYIPVEADTGIMGGDVSHEFMVLAENGEDTVVCCTKCNYAASLNKAECLKPGQGQNTKVKKSKQEKCKEVKTPGLSTVKDVADFLNLTPDCLVKTLIYVADGVPVAVLVCGNHDVNEAKLMQSLKANQLIMADEALIKKVTKGPLGFSGPVGLQDIEIIADYGLLDKANFVAGANKPDLHLMNVNIDKDFKVCRWADVRNITDNDVCPRCTNKISIHPAIEVGHVFKLGTKYTDTLNATYLSEAGKSSKIIMGCYGIGVTRIIAACIEQNHDKNGIIWPKQISPFQVVVMPLNSEHTLSMNTAEELYDQLNQQGLEVLLDDRNVRAGIKFKDADLIGIPIQIIIGEKNLAAGLVEVKMRATDTRDNVPKDNIIAKIAQYIKEI